MIVSLVRAADRPHVLDVFSGIPFDEDFEQGLCSYFYRSDRSTGRMAVVEQGLALNPALAPASLALLLNCGPVTVGERVLFNAALSQQQRTALLPLTGRRGQDLLTNQALPDQFMSFHADNLWDNAPEAHFGPNVPGALPVIKREARLPSTVLDRFSFLRGTGPLNHYFLEQNYRSANNYLKRWWPHFDTDGEGQIPTFQETAACITPYATEIEAAIHSTYYPIRVAACLNRNLFDEAIEQVIKRGNRRLMRYLLWNEAVPIQKLPVQLLLPLWPLELAERHDAKPDLLAELSRLALVQENNQALIDTLLIHPNLDAESFHLIVEQASHGAVDSWIRTAEIVTNDMVEHAARKRPSELRGFLSRHPRSKAMASQQQVGQRVWQALEARGQPKLLDEMMTDRSPRVRAVVAAHTRTSSVWERLIEDRSLHVAYHAAQNPHFVAETLHKYANESHLIHYAWLRSGTLSNRQAASQIKREGEMAEYCLRLTKSSVAQSQKR